MVNRELKPIPHTNSTQITLNSSLLQFANTFLIKKKKSVNNAIVASGSNNFLGLTMNSFVNYYNNTNLSFQMDLCVDDKPNIP